MNKRIKKYLDDVFRPYRDSGSIRVLKEELLNNMQEKYKDLIRDGLDEEAAYQRVIDDLGDISEIIETISDKREELHQRINWDMAAFQRTFDVSEGGCLHLDSDIGSVEVRGADSKKAEVKVFCNERDLNVEFDQKGNDIYVRGRSLGGKWLWFLFGLFMFNWNKIKFVVTVPKKFNADLRTSGGSMFIASLEGEVNSHTSGGGMNFNEITGPVRGKTSGGSISLRKCAGRIDVHTSGGSISIDSASGDIKSHTTGGSIHAKSVEGDLYAHTTGGSINIRELAGSVKAKTMGGSVSAQLLKQPESGCSLETTGGNVTISFTQEPRVDIDAETFGGRVSSDFKVIAEAQGSRGFGQSVLKGKINEGGPLVFLRTMGGNVHVRRG